MYCASFWVYFCVGLHEQWRRSHNLVQASGSRLSESIRKPSLVLRELSLRRQVPILSESPSCSGKEVSPKQESAIKPLFHFSSSRLGKGGSSKRGKPLAWARPFRLSENWARMLVLFLFLFLDVWHMFGLITL